MIEEKKKNSRWLSPSISRRSVLLLATQPVGHFRSTLLVRVTHVREAPDEQLFALLAGADDLLEDCVSRSAPRFQRLFTCHH